MSNPGETISETNGGLISLQAGTFMTSDLFRNLSLSDGLGGTYDRHSLALPASPRFGLFAVMYGNASSRN